ncbi:MAG: hypothetical protein ABI663_12340 [Chryseolinea sp.]
MNRILILNSMYRKGAVILLLFTFFALYASAQQGSALPPNIRAVNTIERLTDSNGLGTNEMMYGIPFPEGKVIGDTYLNLEWRKATILLYDADKLIEGYSARYDIQTNELDIETSNGIKALSGTKVKSFVWMDSQTGKSSFFINAKEYHYNETVLNGFFEVRADGATPLFKKVNLILKKADYNVALNTGSRDDKILKKVVYYYGQGDQVLLLPSSKKKMLSIFKKDADKVNAFINENGLSVKNEDHLDQIFSYFNSLSNTSKRPSS